MVTYEPIGNITIKKIKDFILDNNLSDLDSVVIATDNFDDIAIEYRNTYDESITVPFYLLNVLVKEKRADLNYIGYIKDDPERYEGDYDKVKDIDDLEFTDLSYYETIFYRCGWCGNVVDSDGQEFDSYTRSAKIKLLTKFSDRVTVKRVQGQCCPNGEERATLKRQENNSGFEILSKMISKDNEVL